MSVVPRPRLLITSLSPTPSPETNVAWSSRMLRTSAYRVAAYMSWASSQTTGPASRSARRCGYGSSRASSVEEVGFVVRDVRRASCVITRSGCGSCRCPRSRSRAPGPAAKTAAAAGATDAGRGAGEDDIAGQQWQHRGELGDQARHAEDEVAGAGVLHRLAVDRAAQREIVGVRHLVGGDEPRPHGPVAPPGLAQRELRAGGELEGAVADVLADGQPGDVGPGVGLVDPVGPDADDRDQLDLPVDGVADDLDVVERARQRGRELGEGGGDARGRPCRTPRRGSGS